MLNEDDHFTLIKGDRFDNDVIVCSFKMQEMVACEGDDIS